MRYPCSPTPRNSYVFPISIAVPMSEQRGLTDQCWIYAQKLLSTWAFCGSGRTHFLFEAVFCVRRLRAKH